MIHHADCLDGMRGLDADSVDAIVTDPPYKLSQEYGSGADADNLVAVSCLWVAAPKMLRVAKPGSLCVMYYDSRILPLALECMGRAGWKYVRNLTFYRKWGSASLTNGWMSTSDFILVFRKPGAKPRFFGPARHDVYVRSKPESEDCSHPAQKPLDDVRHIVRNITPPGGLILDPFTGSGTTGCAAALEGFRFIGFEREAEYVEIARRRIAHHAATVQPELNPCA